MEIAFKVLLGAAIGAGLGVVLGRARLCSSTRCNVRANMAFSILAGALFGAAVAWWYVNR